MLYGFSMALVVTSSPGNTGVTVDAALALLPASSAIEVLVVATGWALGVVTVLCAPAIGPLAQLFLPRLTVAEGPRAS